MFAAFLATLVLTYRIPQFPVFAEVVAFGLLSVTLVRRIALASPFAPTSQILSRTRPIIEIASTSAVICLFIHWSWSIETVAGIQSSWIFTGITIVGLSLLLIVQELVFRDYSAWWHAKFAQRREDMESFQALWLVLSLMFLKLSVAEKNKSAKEQWRENAIESNEFLPTDDLDDVMRKNSIKLAVQFTFILIISFAVPAIIGFVGFGVSGILLGISVVLIHDHSCFLYVAYGDPSYEEFRRKGWTIGIWMLVYVLELIVLLPGSRLSL